MKLTSAKQLGIVIKDCRKQKNTTQMDVARKIGIRQDTVSKFEIATASAKMETLFKILAALDLELHIESRNHQEIAEPDAKTEWKEEW